MALAAHAPAASVSAFDAEIEFMRAQYLEAMRAQQPEEARLVTLRLAPPRVSPAADQRAFELALREVGR